MSRDRHQVTRYTEHAYRIIVGRAVSPLELRDEQRDGDPPTLRLRLLSSPEFRGMYAEWLAGRIPATSDADYEGALRALSGDAEFVAFAYECLLGRPADDDGRSHYTSALAAGEARVHFLRSLIQSEEFATRYRDLARDAGLIPHDTQLCELANPAKWDNPDWLDILRSLGLSDSKAAMHRKPYEFAQLIYGCRRLGVLGPDSSFISVGAGHELVLYWLANHISRVVATDMYEGVWQDVQGREGDPAVLQRPDDYAPFPYRRERLDFMKMDGRNLAFRDAAFDVAYSLSSIEHFGGVDGASETIREMARVVKSGGIVAIATEYVLKGPPHDETFLPAEFHALMDQPGLRLVQPVDVNVYDRYEHAAVDLYRNPYQTPHMVVRFDDTVFTTVMAFLRKM